MGGKNHGRLKRRQELRDTVNAYEQLQNETKWSLPKDEVPIHTDTSTDMPNAKNRITTHLEWAESWAMIHYSIKHEVYASNKWQEVYRSDSSHAKVHRHENLPYSNDYTVLKSFECLQDIAVAYEQEHEHVLNTWNKRAQAWGCDDG